MRATRVICSKFTSNSILDFSSISGPSVSLILAWLTVDDIFFFYSEIPISSVSYQSIFKQRDYSSCTVLSCLGLITLILHWGPTAL